MNEIDWALEVYDKVKVQVSTDPIWLILIMGVLVVGIGTVIEDERSR